MRDDDPSARPHGLKCLKAEQRDQLLATFEIEFAIGALELVLHGANGDSSLLGHSTVWRSRGHGAGDLELPGGER